MESNRKGIAIIGAGLAGLTAAYFIRRLRRDLPITIFEASERQGGRVYTSTVPPGEHGARYLLKSELNVGPGCDYWRDYALPDGRNVGELFRELKIRIAEIGERDWPYCCILKSQTIVRLDPSGKKLKQQFPFAADVIGGLERDLPRAQGKFTNWLKHKGRHDKPSLKILKMILAGETSAPWTHLSAQYALQCLASTVDAKEEWLTVKKNTGTLIEALAASSAGRIKQGSTCLKVRKVGHQTVDVTYSNKTGIRKSAFEGVIISSPDGQSLIRSRSNRRHYHSYISILLECSEKPTLQTKPKADLRDGLYTDDRLVNYLEASPTKKGRWVLRILVPNADELVHWSDKQIEGRCIKVLTRLKMNGKPHISPSIKRWKIGLPCGGTSCKYEEVSGRIYLCGDRYGRWPSMAAAIVSGATAADALLANLSL